MSSTIVHYLLLPTHSNSMKLSSAHGPARPWGLMKQSTHVADPASEEHVAHRFLCLSAASSSAHSLFLSGFLLLPTTTFSTLGLFQTTSSCLRWLWLLKSGGRGRCRGSSSTFYFVSCGKNVLGWPRQWLPEMNTPQINCCLCFQVRCKLVWGETHQTPVIPKQLEDK